MMGKRHSFAKMFLEGDRKDANSLTLGWMGRFCQISHKKLKNMPTQPLMEIVLILKRFIATYGLLSNEKRVWSFLNSVGHRFQVFKFLKKLPKN